MEYRTINRTSLAESLLKQLEAEILNGRLNPGDRVTEATLCEGFGVGRSTVREALAAAVMLGMVVRRQDGTFVQPLQQWRHQELTHEVGLLKASGYDILETREALELDIVRFAAERAADEDIRTLESFIVPDVKVEEFIPLDQEFHCAMADATHNDVLAHIYRHAVPLFFKTAKFRKRLQTPENQLLDAQLVQQAMKAHMAILDAVKNHDPVLAAQRAKEHLDAIREGLVHMK